MANISFELLRQLAKAKRAASRPTLRRVGMVDVEHFRQLKPGLWECVASGEYHLASGRIQVTPGLRFARGTTFMGVDLAKLLDEEYERNRR